MGNSGFSLSSIVMAGLDILFLRRLFLVNKGLWAGEWCFHISFVVVVLGHLVLAFNPVPKWVMFIRPWGLRAGYFLPFSLLYILLYRLLIERRVYLSRLNLFLTVLLLLIASTGLLMREVFGVDFLEVKEFVLRGLAFSPAPFPESRIFLAHYLLVLTLVAFLPSHIFTAPYVVYAANKREEEREGVIHGT
jgi:nitrate reductase gamma subunit